MAKFHWQKPSIKKIGFSYRKIAVFRAERAYLAVTGFLLQSLFITGLYWLEHKRSQIMAAATELQTGLANRPHHTRKQPA